MAVFVVPLSNRRACDPSVAGGKGAGLARLLKAGFPVPSGFVITTAAFRRPIEAARSLVAQSLPAVPGARPSAVGGAPVPDPLSEPEPRGGDGSAPAPTGSDGHRGLAEARRFCLEWDVPGKLRRAVLEAYRRLGGGPVAVRSSLVGEDAAGASFAGQLDTVLDVAGEERSWTPSAASWPPRSGTGSGPISTRHSRALRCCPPPGPFRPRAQRSRHRQALRSPAPVK